MKFEPKMSGTKVTDYKIKLVLKNSLVYLDDCAKVIKKQETMNYLLDTFRFFISDDRAKWFALLDNDTLYKIAILENYPQYEKEMIDYFGENWLKHYIRFNH